VYESFYGLRERPFELTSNLKYDRDIVRDVCRDFDVAEESEPVAAGGAYGDFVPRPASRMIQGPPSKEPSIVKV
jgi:hypothetical protein